MAKTQAEINVEYYPRKSVRGKFFFVRNGRERSIMADKLTKPYALGIYTGTAATGAVMGMAMMRRRKLFERLIINSKLLR